MSWSVSGWRSGGSGPPTIRPSCRSASPGAGAALGRGVILGFEQLWGRESTSAGPENPESVEKPFPAVSSWNHLEAGILFTLNLPLLVCKENGIEGVVFDPGFPVFMKWQAKVCERYYR